MKLANEIVDTLITSEPEAPFVCDTDTKGNILVPPEYLKSIIAAKLKPVRTALQGLMKKTDVNDYIYAEYEAAEQALAMLSDEN